MLALKKIDWKNLMTKLWERLPIVALGLDLVAVFVLYAFMTAHVPTQNGDNIEHIHSSFLIAQGQVPYRDFFQHHNPLMWYLFAPLVNLFAYNATVTEVVCLISLLVCLKSLVYVYKIGSEFLCDKRWALVMAAAIVAPSYKLYAVDFRPDNYMVFALMGGIYYYFSYLKEHKTSSLVIAFVWFFVSFMFAQKAVFPLFVLGCSGLYFWYVKEIKTADMLKALLLPIIGAGLFVAYLCYYDMLELYYASNYTFNLNLVNGFDMHKIVELPPFMAVLVWIGFAGMIAACVYRNKYWILLAVLFVTEFIQRKFYFSPYSYYYWLLIYFAALCGVPLLARITFKNTLWLWVAIVGLYFVFYKAMFFYTEVIKAQSERKYLPDYIARSISPCDYVFNGDGMMYNIFGKDPSYYWQLIGQLDVIGEQTGIAPKPNMNELILKLKPKFVYGKSYFNKFSDESGRMEIVHYIDKDILNKYYEPTRFSSVYMLKKEFDKRRCVYDKSTEQWHFVDKK